MWAEAWRYGRLLLWALCAYGLLRLVLALPQP